MIIDITPVPKPRQTRADKWKKRPSVLRYRAFADEVRYKILDKDMNGKAITFGMPMPKSWSKKKRIDMDGKPHTQRPDIDNLAKALFDALYALYEDDSCIHTVALKKVWSKNGYVKIEIGQ